MSDAIELTALQQEVLDWLTANCPETQPKVRRDFVTYRSGVSIWSSDAMLLGASVFSRIPTNSDMREFVQAQAGALANDYPMTTRELEMRLDHPDHPQISF